jgi:hypothetical protein
VAAGGLVYAYLKPHRLPAHATVVGTAVYMEADVSGFWFWPCLPPVAVSLEAAPTDAHVTTPGPQERWDCLARPLQERFNNLCFNYGVACSHASLQRRFPPPYDPHFSP